MKSLILIRSVIGKILNFSGVLAGLLLVIIGFIVTWGVISRYFFLPSYWIEPYSIYLFIASSFLAGAYAMKTGEHIKIDILISNLSTRARKFLDIVTSLIAFAFFIYLTWRSTVMVMQSYHNETKDLSILEIHLWIPQSFVALGSILMCLSLIFHILTILLVKVTEGSLDERVH